MRHKKERGTGENQELKIRQQETGSKTGDKQEDTEDLIIMIKHTIHIFMYKIICELKNKNKIFFFNIHDTRLIWRRQESAEH